MSDISYKGYHGSVTYDGAALLIQVLHVEDLLTTECESAKDVRSAFVELIDDYLATCAQLGREPQKPFRGTFNVRITPELHKQAAMCAAEADISLNSWVSTAIEDKVRHDKRGAQIGE